MILTDKFKEFPNDIINYIINFTDVIVCRNGKYINRINKSDNRYIMLKRLPKPVRVGEYKLLLKLMDYNMRGYFIEYDIGGDVIKVNMRFFYREIDGFDKYYEIKTNETYLLYNKSYKSLEL